jgi:hypothetical protein
MKKLLPIFIPILVIAIAGFMLKPHSAYAFNANNVIDDGVFDRAGSMSAAQIDTWLNTNFPSSCISTNNGFSAPDPTGYSPNPSQFFYSGSPVTAGQVIYDASQAYGMNPQVMIATLEKEEGLVSGGSGCSSWRYASAVGYGCTDSGTNTHDYSYPGGGLVTPLYYINGSPVSSITGSCVNSGPKAGFTEQVIHAAWLFSFSRHKSEGDTAWAVIKGNWNNCDDNNTCPAAWNIPASDACYSGFMTQGTFKRCPTDSAAVFYDGYTTIDGTSTHMDNGATAAFYVYTPHFAGNSSFDTIFETWFGPVHNARYSWAYQGQAVYTDSTKAVAVDSYHQALTPNTRYYFTLAAQNTGNVTWQQGQVKLGTSGPTDRSSILYDSSWLSSIRPATMLESTVAPGQTAHFEFWVKTPNSLYGGREYFSLVDEGVSWFNDVGLNWVLNPPAFTWQYQGQAVYTDNTKTKSVNSYSQALSPNTSYYFTLAALNTGNVSWKQGDVVLGTLNPTDRSSILYDSSWLSPKRPATMLESTVAPGQTAHFEFWVKTPNSLYGGKEYFGLLEEGVMWMNNPGLNWVLNTPSFTWGYQGQAVYTDSTKAVAVDSYNQALTPNTRYYFTLTARNTGNVTWQQGLVKLGTARPTDRSSLLYDSSWLYQTRPATMLESSVAPGQDGHFEFWITTPSSSNGKEYFDLLDEGVIWMNDLGLNWVVKTP